MAVNSNNTFITQLLAPLPEGEEPVDSRRHVQAMKEAECLAARRAVTFRAETRYFETMNRARNAVRKLRGMERAACRGVIESCEERLRALGVPNKEIAAGRRFA